MEILTFFANPAVRDIGAVAILTGVVLAIIAGWLIPYRTHKRELAAADQRTADAIARGNEWKDTADKYEAVNQEIRSQNSMLIKANEVVEAFLRSAGPSQGDTTQPSGGT